MRTNATAARSSSSSSTSSILFASVLSRALVFVLALVVVPLANISDYDTSSSLIWSNNSNNTTTTIQKDYDFVLSKLVRFAKWDSVYFLRIAEYGYEYEQVHAFFPLFPLLLRFLGWLIHSIFGFGFRASLVLSGVLVPNLFFVLSAQYLYKLGTVVLKDEKLAFQSVLLFTLSPASIFFSAPYTESLFSFLVFCGLFNLYSGKEWLATILFSLASFTRSNGILLCGFILYFHFGSDDLVQIIFSTPSLIKKKGIQGLKLLNKDFVRTFFGNFKVSSIRHVILQSFIICFPYVIFQRYTFLLYCDPVSERPWCESFLPNSYGFIQKQYWNQGFFNYYEIKQIPNFLLASPAIIISTLGTLRFFQKQYYQSKFRYSERDEVKSVEKPSPYHKAILFPFVVYWTFLLFFSITFMHVQVITRFFSHIPPLYWYCATFFQEEKSTKLQHRGSRKLSCAAWSILFYSFTFMIVGTVLFTTFYPWT